VPDYPPLEEILRPPRFSHRRHDWDILTTGQTLFEALKRAAAAPVAHVPREHWFVRPDFLEADTRAWRGAGTACRLLWHLKEFWVDRDHIGPDAQTRWEVLGRMLWCFDHVSSAQSAPVELDSVRRGLPVFSRAGIEPPPGGAAGR
jgi:hypothetical protein